MTPFDDDNRDDTRAGHKSPDRLGDNLARLDRLAQALPGEELQVLLLVAERLTFGRERYGSLHVASDARNWRIEALEEAADGLVYAACGLMRAGR